MRPILSYFFQMTKPLSLTSTMHKTLCHYCAISCNISIRRFNSCDQEDDMSKIGINGFGRIGRLVLRAALERGGQVSKIAIRL